MIDDKLERARLKLDRAMIDVARTINEVRGELVLGSDGYLVPFDVMQEIDDALDQWNEASENFYQMLRRAK